MRQPAKIDWWGNVTFAVGLIAVLVGITYGIQPYGGHTMGWTNPYVLTAIFGGIALLGRLRASSSTASNDPMFHLRPVQDPGLHRRQHRPACWPLSAAAACSSS